MSDQEKQGRETKDIGDWRRRTAAASAAAPAGAKAGAATGPGADAVPEDADHATVVSRIDALRDEIDRLDEQLVQLLSARAGCALEIGLLKKRLALEIYQPAREVAVLRHVREVNQGPLDDDAIARLFERIIDEARRLERVEQEKKA